MGKTKLCNKYSNIQKSDNTEKKMCILKRKSVNVYLYKKIQVLKILQSLLTSNSFSSKIKNTNNLNKHELIHVRIVFVFDHCYESGCRYNGR